MKSQRHVGLTRLRGLAALMVVFGHSFHVYSINEAQSLFNPVFLLISAGTVIFVLISGILFRMIAVPRLMSGLLDTTTILRKRWNELGGTYLSVGLFLAVVIGYKEGIREGINPVLHSMRMMLNGGMAHSYWYVPFFFLLMALTPAHLLFCRQRVSVQAILIVGGLCLSAVIHRPDAYATFGAIHSLIYYLPVFWLGLALGAHFQELLAWLRGKEIIAAGLVLAVIALQTAIGQDQVYLTAPGERWGQIDLFVVQKIIFALLFLSIFDRFQDTDMPLMDWLARYSLTIFFMHCPILILLMHLPHLSGFYVPELVAVTAATILGGIQLKASLDRMYARLPDRIRAIGCSLTGQRAAA